MSRLGLSGRVGAAIVAAAALIAGCAAGPDFRPPAPPQAERFTAAPLPHATAGGSHEDDRAQHFFDPAGSPADWWRVLGSDALDALVDQALRHSPTIAAAEAALREAQELTAAQRGAFFPAAQASHTTTRARVPDVTSSPLSSGASRYTLHTAQLSISYVADVFGGNGRSVESLEAQSEAQAWQLRAARLTLAANVISAALQEAALRDQLAATQRLSGIAERQLKLLETQRRLGAASGAAVFAQDALLQQAEASAAALRKQLAQQRNLLAVLVGTLPADLPAPELQLASLRLPDVPVGMPGRLVEQRPDVRAAEAQLHSANAAVGVAASNMLPQITLTANYGAGAESLGQLLHPAGLAWSVGASVVQPVFQGGTLLHRRRAAEAQLEQALAQYRGTVLSAFQNVADALEAVRNDADQHIATVHQETAALAALRVAQRQLDLGDISVLTLLNAEAASLQATIARIQAQASRYGDVVAVYQALGGSWDDRLPGAGDARSAPR